MSRLRTLSVAAAAVSLMALAACGVDTTGISPESSRTPTGNPSSGVVLTEYGDLQCPACGSAYELINKPLLAKYGKTVRFEFKQFPLKSIHEHAFEAAQASECAADQGKFWEFVDMAFENQKDLSSAQLRVWAKQLNLNEDLFERCVSSGIKQGTINADIDQGVKLGVDSTPTYFVNGTKVPQNAVEAVGAALEQALQHQNSVPL